MTNASARPWRSGGPCTTFPTATFAPPGHGRSAHRASTRPPSTAPCGPPGPATPSLSARWYRTLPEHVRTDPWITPLCQRLARLERAGLPVGSYLRTALTESGPLPDEHAAAALWWRLVPHLGPAAVRGDTHTGQLLQPDWLATLTDHLPDGAVKTLQDSPAWPALVAAVDEARYRHQWTPGELLDSAFQAFPTHLQPAEVCDALLLRVAVLTDPPEDLDPDGHPASSDPDLDGEDAPTPSWAEEPPGGSDIDPPPKKAPAALEEDTTRPPPGDPRHLKSHDPAPATWTTCPQVPPDAAPQVTRAGIVALHEAALGYYADCYPRSWAPAYLRERFGTDPADHPDLAMGYAPPGRTSLIKRMTEAGVSVEELEAAGLAKRRDRGGGQEWVDAFWDRIVFPIRDVDGATIGFVGRRNPIKGDDDYAGPKYLNTRTTAAFRKGEALFGLTEGSAALDAGALPVLVEGPMDALAITLGSSGTAVGIAPLGTALTERQIELLRPCIRHDAAHIAVATDADTAGWRSAQLAYWNLTTIGADPAHLALPSGLDPAELLEMHGADGIQRAMDRRGPLGDAMIDQRLLADPAWSNPATRLALVRESGLIIAARQPRAWADAIDRVNQRLHLSPGVLHLEVIDHSQARAENPTAYAQERITDIHDRARLQQRHSTGAPRLTELAPHPTTPTHPAAAPQTDIDINTPAPPAERPWN